MPHATFSFIGSATLPNDPKLCPISGQPPPLKRLVLGSPHSASTDLSACSVDKPGTFGEGLLLPTKAGCWVEQARGSTHRGTCFLSVQAVGATENVENLIELAEHHRLFPAERSKFQVNRRLPHKCGKHRYEIFLEAPDDAQVATIAILAGKHGLNIVFMEVHRIPTPVSGGEHLAAEFIIDIPPEARPAFAELKSDIAVLMNDGQLIRVWGPMRESESGPRPTWRCDRQLA